MKRRQFIQSTAVSALAPQRIFANDHLRRVIPSSGERIPAVGMGSWLTFDIGDADHELKRRIAVLQAFFDGGGALIDSSPMYGTSQLNIGRCLSALNYPSQMFSASKVWIPGGWLGKRQMANSVDLWGVEAFDLMQIHNLLDWETHLATLTEWKAAGRIRYIGVTTSHGRRHDLLMKVMENHPLDFIQLTYNVVDREAEQRLLPAAMARGIAVIANRPFRRSLLFDRVRNVPLPGWAKEIECRNWAQVFLKFILSHRAVTCVIPATSRADHMKENIGALSGPLPDARLRRRIVQDYMAI